MNAQPQNDTGSHDAPTDGFGTALLCDGFAYHVQDLTPGDVLDQLHAARSGGTVLELTVTPLGETVDNTVVGTLVLDPQQAGSVGIFPMELMPRGHATPDKTH